MNNSTHEIIPPYYKLDNVVFASQIVGYIAGSSVVILNIPQLIIIIKNKSAKDVSVYTIILNLVSGILFLTYGILLYQFPLIVCNSLYCIVTLILLYCKLYFDKKNKNIEK
jgi:MtN3 and saliva related transmembrane protein